MPSETFLRLAPEKQEKLLAAAVREFTAQPYHEASINSIIREAGIPRGSFYMYFRDKGGLFHYLVHENTEQDFSLVFREILDPSSGGDIFAALPRLYDYLHDHREGTAQLGELSD